MRSASVEASTVEARYLLAVGPIVRTVRVMRITIHLDDQLLADAQEAAGTPTVQSTVHLALEELVRRKGRESLLGLRGSGWEGDLDESRLGRNI
jgi:Arc/MetJ family transcription regulator